MSTTNATSANGSTTTTTLVSRLTAAQRKLLAKSAGVKVHDLHDGHIATVQVVEQKARDATAQAAKDATNTAQVQAAMQGKPVSVPAAVMPAGLSIAEECAWINAHGKGVVNSTAVPFIGADAKGLSISHNLPFHPQGWTGDEIAAECDLRGTVDTGASGTKLVGVKGTPVKKSTKLPGSVVGTSIRKLAAAGHVYNG